jgi:hypothetical protein
MPARIKRVCSYNAMFIRSPAVRLGVVMLASAQHLQFTFLRSQLIIQNTNPLLRARRSCWHWLVSLCATFCVLSKARKSHLETLA